MALTKCMECGHEISDRATSCPNCGCPLLTTDNGTNITRNNIEEVLNQIILKIKTLPLKISVTIAVVFLVLIATLLLPSGVERHKAVLEDCLLEPSSLIIYEAYTNRHYGDGGRATLFYFGATNKRGGISDDWAFIYDGDILFESNYNTAVENDDNLGILENGELVWAKFAIEMGSEKWKKVNMN